MPDIGGGGACPKCGDKEWWKAPPADPAPPPKPRINRIKVVLPLYGSLYPKFVIHWLEFQQQIARFNMRHGQGATSVMVAELAPADMAMNEMVREALKDPDWDYLFSCEQDMRMPAGLLDRLGSLNPDEVPIYGCLYFGRAQENQAPVPGYWRKGRLHRLTYEEVCTMLPQRGGRAGLHRVDTIGMGATAIHRSVLEQWPWTPSHPWFRFDYDHMGPIGHDVWFCVEAGRQGYPIHVDSSMVARHMGDWQSDDVSYLATEEHSQALIKGREEQAARTPVVIPFVGGSLRAETKAAAYASGLPVDEVGLIGDGDYHDLIAELWSRAAAFITLEQDIVPHEGALRELAECPEPWCAFAYDYPPFGRYAGMGCAKFSAELLARYPQALAATGTWKDEKHPPKHWCRVDGWLKQYLMERGVTQHIHGEVKHLHRGRPAHNCVAVPPLPLDVPTAVTEAEAAALAELAAGKRVLEMGSHLGFSTIVLAHVAAELHSVDHHRGDLYAGEGDSLTVFRDNLRSHGVEDRVVIHVGRFEDVLPMLAPESFDLVFIDGVHAYEAVRRDIALTVPLLVPAGVIAFHDYGREQQPGFREGDWGGFSAKDWGVTRAVDELGLHGEIFDTLAVVRPTAVAPITPPPLLASTADNGTPLAEYARGGSRLPPPRRQG